MPRAASHGNGEGERQAFRDEADAILEHAACDIRDEIPVCVRPLQSSSARDAAHDVGDALAVDAAATRSRSCSA
jgi:hypothetical protein